MEKPIVNMCLTALIVVCIRHGTGSDAALSVGLTNHVNYVFKAEHWEKTRFNMVRCDFGWMSKRYITNESDTIGPIDKLKIFPYMMGCAYGQKLFDFLWLTIHTGDVCKSLSEKIYADDCWSKLQVSLIYGAFTAFELIRILELIHTSDPSIIPSPYYGILSSIRNFLDTYDPRRNSNDGELNGPRQIIILANFLGNILDSNCRPKHDFFVVDNLPAKWAQQNTISNLYDFFVNRLDSYASHISDHVLLRLRFHYEASIDKMMYTTPTQSD